MTYNIDKTKIKTGMVIHCDTEEKARALIEQADLVGDLNSMWNSYGDQLCIRVSEEPPVTYGGYDWYIEHDYVVTPFDDLLVKRSPVAKLLGVDDDRPFKFNACPAFCHRVSGGHLEYYCADDEPEWEYDNIGLFSVAERAKEGITYEPHYSPQTIAQAKMFLEAGYGSVMPDPESEKGLMYVEGFMGGTARHTYVRNMFTDVTERTLLSEIVGCE